MIGNWTTISGHLQGDISYILRKILVTPTYVDFELTTFGEKWTNFDIAFEYRINNKEAWRDDSVISQTTAKYLRGNKLYGLTASKDGITHTIQWKYSENDLLYSSTAQIRIRPLPRIRVFGSAGHYYPISSAYGDSLIDLDGMSRHGCIGIDNSGRYMCVGAEVFYVIDSLDVEEFSSSSSISSESSSSESSSSQSSSSTSSSIDSSSSSQSISSESSSSESSSSESSSSESSSSESSSSESSSSESSSSESSSIDSSSSSESSSSISSTSSESSSIDSSSSSFSSSELLKHFEIDTGGTLTTDLVSYYKMEDTTDFYGSNNLTNNGSVFVAGKVSNCASCDNTSDYLYAASSVLDYLSSWSYAGWIKFADVTPALDSPILSISGPSDAEFSAEVLRLNSTGKIATYVNKTNEASYGGEWATALTDNVWYHFAVVCNGSNVTCYLNNSSIDGGTWSNTLDFTTNSAGRFNINLGVYDDSSQPYLPFIDELGIWNKALSTQEITDLYNGGNGQTMI